MAFYVFVAVAFVAGLVCAGAYSRVRGYRHPRRSRQPTVSHSRKLIRSLDAATETPELTGTLLRQLVDELEISTCALFVREDIEFRVISSRALGTGAVDEMSRKLNADDTLTNNPHSSRLLQLNDGRSCALAVVHAGGQTGVVTLYPASAVAVEGRRHLVEVLVSHALARLAALEFSKDLAKLGTEDAVTHLHNSRYFGELFMLEFGRSLRYQHPIAVLMCSMEGIFSATVDEGRIIGDARLRKMARAFSASLRQFDVLGRYSPETLAVLLPEADEAVAMRVAQRLVAATYGEEHHESANIRIGIACKMNSDAEPDILLRRASDALQRARQSQVEQICTDA